MRPRNFILLLFLAVQLPACASGRGDKSKAATPMPVESVLTEQCICLMEKNDLWLCGMADEPTRPYDLPNRQPINDLLVSGTIAGACVSNVETE